MPTITTVIPVYNGEKHITDTLESLARQTRRPDRVVVVDDGSKDRTEEIVRNFKGVVCEWAPNERNLGLFPNHNSAIRFAAETRFFHILHANDLILPNFFERLVPLIEKCPGFAMAYSAHVFIQEDGAVTERKGGIKGTAPRRLSRREFLVSQSELSAIQLHSAIMKTDFQPLPVKFRLEYPQTADVVFHSEFVAQCSEVWADPEIHCQVRIHEGSASSQNSRSLQAWVLDEWRTMQVVREVMKSSGVEKWTDEMKLKLLFAARSVVKVKMVRDRDPEYAREIKEATVERTSLLYWKQAEVVVALRDKFFPKPVV